VPLSDPRIRPFDCWILRGLLGARDVGPSPEDSVSRSLRSLVIHLAELPFDERTSALNGYLCARPDAEAFRKLLSSVNPDAAPPRDEAPDYATLDDLSRLVSTQCWLWPGWIASGVVNALAAEPGIGKTRFALDLARRLWHAEPWPDGHPPTAPCHTRTLWVPGDRNFAELVQVARDFNLPGQALALGAPPEDPVGGLDLDDPESLEALAGHIRSAGPALVVIDTIGMVTARNLCRTDEARAFYAPLIEMAARTDVAILGLTHLSIHKEALGRRVVEKARVLLKLTHPDPDGQPMRRRLWVDKMAGIFPPPLGVTMGSSGNTYDLEPPVEPGSVEARLVKPSTKLRACTAWLAERLDSGPMRLAELRRSARAAGFPPGTLYAAKAALGVEEFFEDGRKIWIQPQPHGGHEDPEGIAEEGAADSAAK
jgi:hypothetical protein